MFHQTTHKILYFNYLYILSPTVFGIITDLFESRRSQKEKQASDRGGYLYSFVH